VRSLANCVIFIRISRAIATSSPTSGTSARSTTEAGRELNLILVDYDNPDYNVFEVTEEVYSHNAKYGTREDVVFLVNGIPVLVIECKNATKDEAIAPGVDQVRRYHAETPELFVPQMVFTATEAIGFAYGVTWNLIRRNIFNWKHEEKGNLEAKVKSFCSLAHVLTLLKDYILFAEKDEELQKFILRQHQTTAVEKVVERCLTALAKSEERRGLVAHARQWQDIHDDQSRRAAVQGGRR
jgi:type I restriction enzyme, R subunit